MRMMRASAEMIVLLLALLAAAASSARASSEWTLLEEAWYVMEIAEAPAGWTSAMVYSDGEQYRTETVSRISVRRGPIELEVETHSEFIETHDGRPVSLKYMADMAQQKISSEWIFHADRIEAKTRQGDRTLERELPLPEGKWLTPMAVDRYLTERQKAGATEITYRAISPENGPSPITVTSVRQSEERYEHLGREIPVVVWQTITDAMPLPMIEKYSTDHELVYSELTGPLKMVSRLVTREQALAAAGNEVPELMLNSFVPVREPIANVMNATKATLRLRAKEGKLPELPSAGAQRVQVDEEAVVLTIDIDENLAASGEDGANEQYRGASAMVDPEDPLIRKLAASAVRDAPEDRLEQAEAMRRRVHRHISKKGLETAFASASETAKTQTGDCSEHAVLLAAMLRAEGIPARVAMGLVYVDEFAGADDIFGWHMWTQALIDDRWVDLDATLPTRYHAGHVLTATSALADESGMNEMASILMLIGNLEIEVENVQYD